MMISTSEERAEALQELAEYFSEHYPQYSRGAHYLLQLAGRIAVARKPPTKLQWLLTGPAPGAQRGHARLDDPEPHNVRRLRVQFHRYH